MEVAKLHLSTLWSDVPLSLFFIRNISQAVDDNGEKDKVRKLFVSHEGKKEISIDIGPTLSEIDYCWLFSQFSSGIKANIKSPEYADIVQVDRLEIEMDAQIHSFQADFSTSGPDQVISCQVTLMFLCIYLHSFFLLADAGICMFLPASIFCAV